MGVRRLRRARRDPAFRPTPSWTREYADAPVDEPGNDDLGALSSWYVWAALGLFPVTPGAANLALASPLFHTVTITSRTVGASSSSPPGAAAAPLHPHTTVSA